jgi:eukaryotic-like serine/threonine-protein kinase
MASRFTDEQWRSILDLSEAAAELSPQARLSFLESVDSSPDVIQEVFSLLGEYHSCAPLPERVGAQVGHFIITGHLGRGGVGDVYSARDTELERVVALKFLRPEAIELHGAVERVIREARTASALNHPNIVTIHEVIRSESTVAIVMEFVEGAALRQRCGTPLPIPEVQRLGEEIARALAAAHAAGIVHRDIKPENIIVRPDGSLKVLDFGLATSAVPREQADNRISTSHLFAGTWRYMSPEQAGGEAVSGATDIFSLGLVLYELCTGQLPFPANSAFGTLEALVAGDICRPSKLNVAVPEALDLLILAMLAKNPASRPSAAAVAETLQNLQRQLSPVPTKFRRSSAVAALAVLGALAIAAIFLLPVFRAPSRPSAPLIPFPIFAESGSKSTPSFSPDGKRILYAWKKPEEKASGIYVQTVDGDNESPSQPSRLTHSDAAEISPVWSPDGQTIAFLRGDLHRKLTLFLCDPSGGHERSLADLAGSFEVESRSLEWTPDSKWLFISERRGGHSALALVSAETGRKRLLTPTAPQWDDVTPSISPDGKTLAFVRYLGDGFSQIATLQLDRNYNAAGSLVLLDWPGLRTTTVHDPTWASNQDLLFVANPDGVRRIWRSRDGRQPEPIVDLGESVASPITSRGGHRLVYLKNLDDTNIWKLDLEAISSGHAKPATQIIASSRMDQRPAVSPDGTKLAFESNRGGFTEIWIADLRNGQTWPLTHMRSMSGSPRWSHDGKWVVFDSRVKTSSKLFKAPSQGGNPVQLTSGDATDMLPVWSADDQSIYFSSNRSGLYRIWRVPSDGGKAVAVSADAGTAPELTADGEFLYYLKENYKEGELRRIELRSGKEALINGNVIFRGFVLRNRSVYYVTPNASLGPSLQVLNTDTKRISSLGNLSKNLAGGLSIAPDGKFLYYAQFDNSGDEIMLVNNFR